MVLERHPLLLLLPFFDVLGGGEFFGEGDEFVHGEVGEGGVYEGAMPYAHIIDQNVRFAYYLYFLRDAHFGWAFTHLARIREIEGSVHWLHIPKSAPLRLIIYFRLLWIENRVNGEACGVSRVQGVVWEGVAGEGMGGDVGRLLYYIGRLFLHNHGIIRVHSVGIF